MDVVIVPKSMVLRWVRMLDVLFGTLQMSSMVSLLRIL